MKKLLSLRLSYYFIGLLVVFTAVSLLVPKLKFDSAALTLFSVNSFLYGFYIAPILGGQKSRIDELTKMVRSETTVLYKMLILTKKLPDKERSDLQAMFSKYVKACLRERRASQGENEYEELIRYSLEYHGKDQDVMEKVLSDLVSNQQNRTNISMQIGNKVFNNEWMVTFVLFSITTGFVLFLDTGDKIIFKLVAAFLCTGLTMLLIILAKLSMLTHKKARMVWDPYKKFLSSRFYRID